MNCTECVDETHLTPNVTCMKVAIPHITKLVLSSSANRTWLPSAQILAWMMYTVPTGPPNTDNTN